MPVLALIISIRQLKQRFKKKKTNNGTLILVTCYNSIESYFKIDLILTILFYVYFLY